MFNFKNHRETTRHHGPLDVQVPPVPKKPSLSQNGIKQWCNCLRIHLATAAKSLQSCSTLCNPRDDSKPGSSVPGIFQARILDWVAVSFSRRSSQPRDQTQVSHVVGRCFTIWATGEVKINWDNVKMLTDTVQNYSSLLLCVNSSQHACWVASVASDCLWPYRSPGSSVHGILQTRVLEWVAIPFCLGSSQLRNRTWISYVSCIGRWVLYH